MQNINSDELRQWLSNNTLNMNLLTAENDTIVKILAERGLKAVEQAAKEKSFAIDDDADLAVFAEKFTITDRDGVQVANSDWPNPFVNPSPHEMARCSPGLREQFEPKRCEETPLTTDELKAGGWWCGDLSAECYKAFAANNLATWKKNWITGKYDRRGCMLKKGKVYRGYIEVLDPIGELEQIHRRGNNFYWGAPSDQS